MRNKKAGQRRKVKALATSDSKGCLENESKRQEFVILSVFVERLIMKSMKISYNLDFSFIFN